MMDPRSPERWNLTEKLELPSREGLSGVHAPALRLGQASRIDWSGMEPASYVRMGRMASGRPRARDAAACRKDQPCVAEVRSSDTPGPMVELIETFFR